MQKFRIGFILDPPEKIKCLEDTSFYVMKEAHERGHEVFYVDSRDVSSRSGKILARASRVAVNFDDGFKVLETHAALGLETLDLVFIRKDPPFDAHYLYLTHLLEMLPERTAVLNDPAGIRGANEKLYILNFPDVIPETVVSSREDVLLDFIRETGDAVLKPLSERGGIGIVRVRSGAPDAGNLLRESLAQYGLLMAQRFIPEVERTGDSRVLILNGEMIGGYVRIPPKGDFRVSVFHDGRYEPLHRDEKILALAARVKGRLLADGLLFVGLDVIGGKITEINVTSPAGIPESNHFLGRKLETQVVDFLESLIRKS
jgi:glutathione synthase